MRCKTHSGLWTPVHQDLPLEQFVRDFLRIWHVDTHGTAALRRVARRVDLPAALVNHANQLSTLPLRLCADVLDSSFANNLESRTSGIEPGDVWRAVHEFVSGGAVAGASGLKGEWVVVRHPACKPGFKILREVRTHIEIRGAGAATQPLENSTADKIHVQLLHVYGNGAQRLKGVEKNIGPDLMGAVDDGFGVLDVSAAKNHVRDGNNECLLVDGFEQVLGRHMDTIAGFHHVNARAEPTLRLPKVHD